MSRPAWLVADGNLAFTDSAAATAWATANPSLVYDGLMATIGGSAVVRRDGAWVQQKPSGLPVFFSLGDSISCNGGYVWNAAAQPDQTIYRYSWQWYAQAACKSAMRFGGAFGQASYTIEEIVSIWLPSLLSNAKYGDYCFVLMGQNNLGGETAGVLDVYSSAIDKIEAAGLIPILCTLTPGAATAWFHKLNSHIRAVAAKPGRYLCDFTAALTDASTGSWISALTRDAGVHPSELGAWTMGQTAAAVVSKAAPSASWGTWLPRSEAGFAKTRSGGGSIQSQLFLTNNGATPPVPTGWTTPSPGVAGAFAYNTVAGIPGKVLRITKVAGNEPLIRCSFATDGILAGDRIIFTMRITSNIAATGTKWGFSIIDNTGASFYERGRSNGNQIEVDQTDDIFIGEFTANRSAPNGFLDISIYAGTGGYVDISQVQILNLTALGLT